MKTTIHTLYDYHDYPLEKTIVISCPQEHIDREFLHVVRPFRKMIPVQTVQQGDVTMLKLVSDLPKYQKAMVPVTVGGNLFNPELEAQLPGHAVGETFDAAVDGGTVSVTILKATRNEFPSPTDEMVAAYADTHSDYEGVRTIAQYRQKVVDEYMEQARREAIYRPMDEIMDYVLTNSDFNFDPEELAQMENAMMAEQRSYIQEELGISIEEMTNQQFVTCFGIPDYQELLHQVHIVSERQIATILWEAVCNGLDPKVVTPETAKWDFSFLERFVRENVTIVEE